MSKKFFPVLALLLCATGAWAFQTTEGRKVRRITFDRETVNVEYTDGTQDREVQAITISRDDIKTSVKAVNSASGRTDRQWYTIDGRALKSQPRQKGFYIVKGKNNAKKIIKK